ncbi:hypothetical protein [Asaia bogorensis]|uniref:hypothetical protein n=1 Tax=Asaia bogorensis TaxID=91915 RepID=UPI002863EDDD|nr:hypothetical protein [Asaia bogorensis]MDR6182246.1 cell division protein FtsB [Asaia bogorensis NBRC 16594]
MNEAYQPQPWWAAVVGGILFTIRWLIGFGASNARSTIASQREDLARLNARVDKLEQREEENLHLIEELRQQNALLRDLLWRSGIAVLPETGN